MGSYSTNELKNGIKVLLDNVPHIILENEYVKPGKGQAFNRLKLRNLKTGKVLERTLKSGDSMPAADVVDVEMQFLYSDGEELHLMVANTYEQYSVNISTVEDAAKWLKEQDICTVTLWNNQPISLTPPTFVEMAIVETDPGLRGDTSGGGNKPATLETGAVVKVPLFVQTGEIIKVDTRNGGSYVSRVK